MEALNSPSEWWEGSIIPRPPSLAGSAIRFLTMSFGGDRPVIDGINSERIVSSKVCKCSVMSGTVREIYDHLLAMPWV